MTSITITQQRIQTLSYTLRWPSLNERKQELLNELHWVLPQEKIERLRQLDPARDPEQLQESLHHLLIGSIWPAMINDSKGQNRHLDELEALIISVLRRLLPPCVGLNDFIEKQKTIAEAVSLLLNDLRAHVSQDVLAEWKEEFDLTLVEEGNQGASRLFAILLFDKISPVLMGEGASGREKERYIELADRIKQIWQYLLGPNISVSDEIAKSRALYNIALTASQKPLIADAMQEGLFAALNEVDLQVHEGTLNPEFMAVRAALQSSAERQAAALNQLHPVSLQLGETTLQVRDLLLQLKEKIDGASADIATLEANLNSLSQKSDRVVRKT